MMVMEMMKRVGRWMTTRPLAEGWHASRRQVDFSKSKSVLYFYLRSIIFLFESHYISIGVSLINLKSVWTSLRYLGFQLCGPLIFVRMVDSGYILTKQKKLNLAYSSKPYLAGIC